MDRQTRQMHRVSEKGFSCAYFATATPPGSFSLLGLQAAALYKATRSIVYLPRAHKKINLAPGSDNALLSVPWHFWGLR